MAVTAILLVVLVAGAQAAGVQAAGVQGPRPRTEPETIFADGFEEGLGAWEVRDLSGAGARWGESDCWAASGATSAGCAAAGSEAIGCGEDYPDDMKTWLTYGPFPLDHPDIYQATFEFSTKILSETSLDRLFVGVSTNGTDFAGFSLSGVIEDDYVVDLMDWHGSPELWIGFLFLSDGSVGRPDGAQVDDVAVYRWLPDAISYGWTISDSETDPYANQGEPLTGLRTIWLWYACNQSGIGIASMEFGIAATSGTVHSVIGINGFAFGGTPENLWGYVNDCPQAPVRAASILCVDDGTGLDLCFVPSQNSYNLSEDCDLHHTHPNDYVGYCSLPGPVEPCRTVTMCDGPTIGVESASWGAIKAIYR